MTDDSLMQEAIAEADAALAVEEVPVGCVILHVPTDQVIARGHNRRESHGDPTAHAEILALRDAARALGSWRLSECAMAVTLEPCPMCAGAIVNARLGRLVYGCDDPKAGAIRTLFKICDDPRLNHRVQIAAGVMAEKCSQLLRDFFKAQRAGGKK
ncbi:MAG: tRNA adenosine(34) deaminase TadA [Tepidisphaeraceae bacterium]|jgi:tRNA(adenine34) deaminase